VLIIGSNALLAEESFATDVVILKQAKAELLMSVLIAAQLVDLLDLVHPVGVDK